MKTGVDIRNKSAPDRVRYEWQLSSKFEWTGTEIKNISCWGKVSGYSLCETGVSDRLFPNSDHGEQQKLIYFPSVRKILIT